MARPIINASVIKAPIEKVWDTITDFDHYDRWNEFCPQVEGQLRSGGKIVMHVEMRTGRRTIVQTERFRTIVAPTELTYGIDYGPLLYTERRQVLTALPDSSTEYRSELTITGLLSPLALWLFRQDIDRGFGLSLDGLKRFLEA